MSVFQLYRQYLRWAKQFSNERFSAKLIYNIREAFEAEIHLLNDVGAKQTIERQKQLAEVFRSRASEMRQLRGPAIATVDQAISTASYEVGSDIRLEKAAQQMERGRSILRTLQHISPTDTQMMDFLLDKQFFTPKSKSASSTKATKDHLPPAAHGAVVISRT